MKRIEDQAIILKIQPMQGRDRKVTFLSRSNGKKTAIAKGAQGSRRFGSAFELFQVSDLEWVEKPQSTLVRIDSGTPNHTFWNLRKDYELLKTASFFSELVDKSLMDETLGEDSLPLYSFFANFLHTLNKEQKVNPAWASAMKWRWVRLIGFPPRLSWCVICENSLKHSAVYFSPDSGGMVCEDCRESSAPHARKITASAYMDFVELNRMSFENLSVYNFSEDFLKISNPLVNKWMEHHIPEVFSRIQSTASFRSSAI